MCVCEKEVNSLLARKDKDCIKNMSLIGQISSEKTTVVVGTKPLSPCRLQYLVFTSFITFIIGRSHSTDLLSFSSL